MNSEPTELVAVDTNSNDDVVLINSSTSKKQSLDTTDAQSSTPAFKKIKVSHDGVHNCAVTPVILICVNEDGLFNTLVKQRGELSRTETFLIQLIAKSPIENNYPYAAVNAISVFREVQHLRQNKETEDAEMIKNKYDELATDIDGLARKYDTAYQADAPYNVTELTEWEDIDNNKRNALMQQLHCHFYIHTDWC